ncbi:MAG TPA: hypothetical protein VNQ73_22930 [Ilumatobacter sp.]|nr:hypothetical protein [Ilumatobacter sp.]
MRIRYNTKSDRMSLLWRLAVDGEEYLVDAIRISVPVQTTSDWMPELGEVKHHVTAWNATVEIVENDDGSRLALVG